MCQISLVKRFNVTLLFSCCLIQKYSSLAFFHQSYSTQGIVYKRYLVTVKVHCYVDLLLWRTLVNFLSAETHRILFQNVSIWRSSAGDNWNNILVSATRKFANILQNVPCVCLCTFTVCKLVVTLPYSAWGSNFLQIVIFDNFVERVCCACTLYMYYTMGVAYKPGLSNTHHHTAICLSSQL